MPHTLTQIIDCLARHGISATIDGESDCRVVGVATLEEAEPQHISFLSNPRYEDQLKSTRAGVVLVSDKQIVPGGLTVIRVADPYAAITAVMVELHGFRAHPRVGIDPRAIIAPTARIGENASIHHGATIGENVIIGRNANIYPGCHIAEDCRIGDDCLLYPNVVIYDGCILGNRVTIHANSVIGEDGLGYAPVNGTWKKIPQIGIVEIGDDVEIGAGCTIDRATLGKSVIGEGTKFSNHIDIGHGTRIGRHCMFVGQVGIAGSVTVGDHVTMAGKVGVAGHLTIGDRSQFAAMSGVMHDVPPGSKMAGQPAVPFNDAMRAYALWLRLPEINRKLKQLEAQVTALAK